MLRTFDAPFDFHEPDGGRRKFREWAETLAGGFRSRPLIIDDPVFTYKVGGKSSLERIADLNDEQPAIVYLSNVVMHSAVLIVGEGDAQGLERPLDYDSVAAFLESPYVRGYGVDPVKVSWGDTTVVISDFASFQDDHGELRDAGLFRVLVRTAEIYVCNILDFGRYFAQRAVYGEQSTFFLAGDSGVDYHACAQQMDKYALRDYLLDQSIPFATLGDDHVDDNFAVSYGMNCWRCDDEHLAFVR